MKLTREQLYECVWQKPIREVAVELGISDVGLAKACRKSGIPLPHQGHWLKKAGPDRDRLKIILPPPPKGSRVLFDFEASDFSIESERDRARDQAEKRLAETPRSSTEDKNLAQFGKDVRKSIDLRKLDERGIVMCSGRSPWPCRTSPANVDRGIAVLKLLWSRLQSMGVDVEQSEKCAPMVVFEIDGGRYWFWIEEHATRTVRELTPKELAEKQKAEKDKRYWFAPPLWVFTPTGKIAIKLSHESSDYVRRKWADTTYATLEERIDEVVAGTFGLASEEKREREIRAKEAEIEAARQLRVRQELQRKEHEALKTKRLQEEALAWSNAQTLREYVDAVREMPSDALPQFKSETEKSAWIEWAGRKIDKIDPLTNGAAGTTPALPPLPNYSHSWGYRGRQLDDYD